MKNVFKFLIFLLYTITIFFTRSWEILLIEAVINGLVMILIKLNFRKALKNLLGILILTFIMFVANALLIDLKYASIISAKLILVCNITFSFSKVLTVTEFANVIENLCTPLKIFKVNPKDISLIICIAIAFIPILKNQFLQLKMAVKVKGYKLTLINSKILLKPFFISVLERVEEVSNSLKAKGYVE